MRIAIAIAAISLAGCGGAGQPTAQEEALNETARGPEQLAQNSASAASGTGERAGISGETQGPTQGDSDAPAMGDRGSGTGGDSTD